MSFLQHTATEYYGRYHEDVASLCFVFPNRRAGLFFRRYLAQEAGKPLLAPKILTIEQLFEELSTLTRADQTELLFRLYETYKAHAHTEETFDSFLFWGKMMLSDFNDVDMHMVDAKHLYENLKDIKDIEALFESLDEEHKESLKKFAEGFGGEIKNQYRNSFINLWNVMSPVYEQFRTELKRDGLAYEGMLCREVVCNANLQTDPSVKRYVFVGFNALSAVEKELMQQLKQADKADFCWDYSHRFLRDRDNRASLFMDDNLSRFPNSIEQGEASEKLPEITLVQVPSSVGQATIISRILNDDIFKASVSDGEPSVQDLTKVGVVLPDESLLTAVKDNIPACIDNINITMGQQLSQTPVLSLLQLLSQLQLSVRDYTNTHYFYHKTVLALLSHPYISSKTGKKAAKIKQTMYKSNMTYVPNTIFEPEDKEKITKEDKLLMLIFTYHSNAKEITAWLRELLLSLTDSDDKLQREKNEYLYQALLQVNKVERLLNKYTDIQLEVRTIFALLEGLVGSVRVPFEGEPLAGMQIMGMLESRGMDFSNLIIADVNDETLPGRNMQQTYIPYDLRVAYGLPVPERQDAIFAYNFYRLLTGADKVWLLENTTTDDMRSGEASRYVKQLEYLYEVPIKRVSVAAELASSAIQNLSIEKTKEIQEQIIRLLFPTEDKVGLSPSALNTYVKCPVRFYLQQIKKLKVEDKIDDEMQANVGGTIVHEVLEKLYSDYKGKEVTESDIEQMIETVEDPDTIKNLYYKEHFKDSNIPLEGIDYLNMSIIKSWVLNVLYFDKAQSPFVYLASEEKCSATIETSDRRKVKLYGIIDRVHRKDGIIYIIDYKTGKDHFSLPKNNKKISAIYQPDAQKADHIRQLLFYCYLYNAKPDRENSENMTSAIYYVKYNHKSDGFMKVLSFDKKSNYYDLREEYEEQLRSVVEEILDAKTPFIARPKDDNCKYCQFRTICQ